MFDTDDSVISVVLAVNVGVVVVVAGFAVGPFPEIAGCRDVDATAEEFRYRYDRPNETATVEYAGPQPIDPTHRLVVVVDPPPGLDPDPTPDYENLTPERAGSVNRTVVLSKGAPISPGENVRVIAPPGATLSVRTTAPNACAPATNFETTLEG